MPVPFRLDDVIEKTLGGAAAAEQKALCELAGVKFSKSEARALWALVLEHKWLVSERLGRDVGLRVAAIDYFENIYTSPQSTTINRRRGLLRRLMRPPMIYRITASLL